MRRRKLDRLVMAARERAYKKGPGHTSWVIRDPVTDTLVVNRRPTHEVFYKLRVMAYDRFDADWVGLYDDAKLYRVRRWAKLACARVRSRHPKEGEDALVFEVLGNDAVRGEYGRITPSCLARLLGGEAPVRADGWLTEGEIRRVMRQSGLWIVCPVQWAFAKRWAVLMEYEPGDKPLPSLEERRAQRQPRAQVLRYAD